MLTIFFYIRVKPGRENEFHKMAQYLTKVTNDEDEGCLAYIFHRRLDKTLEYVLYEQWENEAVLRDHLAHLVELLGPAEKGEVLPAKFLELCDSTRSDLYDVVA